MFRLLRSAPFGILALFLLMLSLGACGEQEAFHAYKKGQQALGRYEFKDARAHFDHALALDSAYARAYLGRGQVHWQQQRYEDALPDLSLAIELDPHLNWAYYLRASSLTSLHRYEESLADFDRFIASKDLVIEDRVRGHRWRGIALLNLQHPEDALADFSACIALQPEEFFHYRERAQVYEGLGQLDAAIADYDAFLIGVKVPSDDVQTLQHRVDSLRVLL